MRTSCPQTFLSFFLSLSYKSHRNKRKGCGQLEQRMHGIGLKYPVRNRIQTQEELARSANLSLSTAAVLSFSTSCTKDLIVEADEESYANQRVATSAYKKATRRNRRKVNRQRLYHSCSPVLMNSHKTLFRSSTISRAPHDLR